VSSTLAGTVPFAISGFPSSGKADGESCQELSALDSHTLTEAGWVRGEIFRRIIHPPGVMRRWDPSPRSRFARQFGEQRSANLKQDPILYCR